MIIYVIFLSILIGTYGLNKPIISIILGFFLIFILIKEKKKKFFILSFFIILIFYLKLILFDRNIFLHYGIVTTCSDNYFILYNGFSKFYVHFDSHSFKMFDIIRIEGEIIPYSFNTYEGLFDFNHYLQNKFVYNQVKIDKCEQFISFQLDINILYQRFINKFNDDGRTIVSELIFSKEYSTDYSSFIYKNRLFYLLSMSSLHVYFLSYVIRRILETKIKENKVDYIMIIMYLILCILNSFKVSLLRFLIYQIITKIDNDKKIGLSYVRKIVLTLIVLGLIDQSYYYSSSFLYHVFIPLNFQLTKNGLSTFNEKRKKIMRVIYLYIIIVFLNILIDESFSIISIILIPSFTLIVLILVVLSLSSLILPIECIINFFSKGLINIFLLIDKIDLTIYLSNKLIVFFILYIFIYFLYLWSVENKTKFIQKFCVISFVLNLTICKLPINHYDNGVYFINVSQGDSILIHDKNTNVLVDTGGLVDKDVSKEILIPFLKKKSIYHLDYLFMTHNDFDHIGGVESLINSFNVLDYNKTNDFNNKRINNIEFYNLNPSKFNSNNDDSLVLYFTLNNIDYLLLGDISKEKEKEIVQKYPYLNVDVIKVAHHGSDTSTSEYLLNAYNISEAVISCGKNNYYGHPSTNVINRLENHQIKVRRTDEEGTIYIKKIKK